MQQSWRGTHFCSTVFLLVISRQELKEMDVVESFFSNEGTEVTSYNSGQTPLFFMLRGEETTTIFSETMRLPTGCSSGKD